MKAGYRIRLRRKKAFRMLTLSYVALIAISLIFAFINYSKLLDTVRERAVEQTVAHLSQAAQSVNSYVESIENSLINLATNTHVLTYVYRSRAGGDEDYWKMYMAQQEISDACVQNTNLYELAVYTPGTNRVLYSDSSRIADDFYGAYLAFEDDSCDDWKTRLQQVDKLSVTASEYSLATGKNL
ncbi:MAG: hypothetical protein IIX93_06640, partial [Clostridia bacterium]|nr:hypothetical protein [Clostridia bacterium]